MIIDPIHDLRVSEHSPLELVCLIISKINLCIVESVTGWVNARNSNTQFPFYFFRGVPAKFLSCVHVHGSSTSSQFDRKELSNMLV